MQLISLQFSTSAVHPRDRFDFWHDVACKSYVEHECRAEHPSSFEGHVEIAPLGQASLSTYSNAPMHIWRTPRQVSRGQSDDLYLCLQLEGTCQISQDGRDAMLQPGDFSIADTARPYSFSYPENSRQLVLKVGRRQMEARIGKVHSLTAVTVHGADGAGGLASSFMRMLPRYRDAFSGMAELQIANQSFDLVALALSESAGRRGVNLSSASAAAIVRLRHAVEACIADPAARCADVAATAGMSVRYANHLLLQEGTSLERFMQHRRLEKCREALLDPAQGNLSINEIAYSRGFADASHFSRSFKTAYGASPRDYRRKAGGSHRC
jgi:AraC family transcriptional activator of tynA and feaB